MTEQRSDEAPLHGSFGCRPALQSDEFGSYYACSCGWRSDDGQSISKARSVVASLRGVVQAVREQADYWLGSPLPITEGQAGAQVHRALAAAADAPQPEPATTDAGCPVCHARTGCVHSDRLLAAIDALPDESQERCPQGSLEGMTAEQFAQGYAERSRVTVEWLAEHDRVPRPCDCGEDDCDGWQMAHAGPSPAVLPQPETKD